MHTTRLLLPLSHYSLCVRMRACACVQQGHRIYKKDRLLAARIHSLDQDTKIPLSLLPYHRLHLLRFLLLRLQASSATFHPLTPVFLSASSSKAHIVYPTTMLMMGCRSASVYYQRAAPNCCCRLRMSSRTLACAAMCSSLVVGKKPGTPACWSTNCCSVTCAAISRDARMSNSSISARCCFSNCYQPLSVVSVDAGEAAQHTHSSPQTLRIPAAPRHSPHEPRNSRCGLRMPAAIGAPEAFELGLESAARATRCGSLQSRAVCASALVAVRSSVAE